MLFRSMLPDFGVGTPVKLFDQPLFGVVVGRPYDVAPDGRLIVIRPPAPPPGTPPTGINVVLHWADELRAKLGR